MAEQDCMSRLGGWEGYRVRKWRHEPRGERRWLVIELEPLRQAQHCCVGCAQVVAAVHDRTMRCVRDLPVFGDPVELHVPRLRLA
ncbi:transposase family protein, partial [Thermomonas fusca]